MNQALNPLAQQIQDGRDEAALSVLNAEDGTREFVRNHPFALMVQNLAKPGQDIVDSMTPQKYGTLAKGLGFIIGAAEQLDQVKKLVIYNKQIEGVQMTGDIPLDGFDAKKAHMLHMAVGAVGETGELADAIAAHVYDGADLDVANVVEEIGDTLFYLQGLLNAVGFTLHDAIMQNKVKLLGKRYKNGYSDAAAQARADKPAGE